MIRCKRLLLTLLVVSLNLCIQAQGLTVMPLGSYNPSKSSAQKLKSSRDFQDSISLPFVEDFSYSGNHADYDKWLGYSVQINGNLPLKPPTIGVATFDGLDWKGNPYSNSTASGSADTLTSKPFRLAYLPSDSLYLSFFYQPGGQGNFPEFVDSLILEFYKTSDSTWNWVWGSKGEDYPQLARDFSQVMIPIRDTAYLKNGFQFRFRNFAQQNGSWDHWHIDYLKLETGRFRNDTLHNDFAFMYPPSSLLLNYQSLPLWHFLPNANDNMAELYNLSFTSLNSGPSNKLYGYEFFDANFNQVDLLILSSQGPIIPREDFVAEEPVKYTYEDPGTDWTVYYLSHYLSDNNDEISRNDTATYIQVLSNYYALDDGTPEARISINNNGGGFAAQRFDCYLSDSLKAVQMFFNRTIGDVGGQPFYLMIWSAGSNAPGTLIYEQEINYPANQGLNTFATITLDSAIFIPAGTYYIGWAQTNNFEINLGFDRTFNNNSRIYYNLDGNWYNYDAQGGTLMIRPLFGEPFDTYVGNPEMSQSQRSDWKLFPNPASEKATIQFPNQTKFSTLIMDISGRVLFETEGQLDHVDLPVNLFPAGIYLVGVKSASDLSYQFRKLIISKNR
jgi:hypothetical protein